LIIKIPWYIIIIHAEFMHENSVCRGVGTGPADPAAAGSMFEPILMISISLRWAESLACYIREIQLALSLTPLSSK
jgi:hypothetical protein